MRIAPHVAEKYPHLLDFVNLYNSREGNTVFWEDKVVENLTIVDAVPDKLVWEFEVKEAHCNMLGNIHGGCVATAIDICSSFALLVSSDKSQWGTIGVSTDLSISYMLAIPAGSKARLECDVQRVGKKLSYIYTKVFDESGRICYSGSHTKFNIDAKL